MTYDICVDFYRTSHDRDTKQVISAILNKSCLRYKTSHVQDKNKSCPR